MSFLLIFAGFLMTSSKNYVMVQFFFVISKVIIDFYISTDFHKVWSKTTENRGGGKFIPPQATYHSDPPG